MTETSFSRIIGGLLFTTIGVSIGLVGIFITVQTLSLHRRWVALDAEANLYGFPLPWLSKSLSSFEDLLNQARAPPVVGYSAFALDFFFYAGPLLALTYLLMQAASHHRVRRLPRTLMASGTSFCFAGILSVLLAMTFVLTSLSDRMTLVLIDGEVNRYGSPLPWLSNSFGDAVLDTEVLLSQIIAPPTVDYRALFADLAFYMLPASAVIYGFVGLIHSSQYLARRLLKPRTRGPMEESGIRNLTIRPAFLNRLGPVFQLPKSCSRADEPGPCSN